MPKSKDGLRCGYCKRPLITYRPNARWTGTVLHNGPKRGEDPNRWCPGHCDGVIADMQLLLGVLVLEGKVSPKLKRWARKYFREIQKCYGKLIESLLRYRSSKGRGSK